MSCRRAEEIDLLAFAVDRTSDEWADFRDHYPLCADCSRLVARLSKLESLVGGRTPEDSAHLDEGQLLDFADGRLEGSERLALEAHLEDCAACRTELGVLRTFDIGRGIDANVIPIEAKHRSAQPSDRRGSSASARRVGALWRRPAMRYAAAAAALFAFVLWSVAQNDPGPAPSTIAARPPASNGTPALATPPVPEPFAPGEESGSFAEATPPAVLVPESEPSEPSTSPAPAADTGHDSQRLARADAAPPPPAVVERSAREASPSDWPGAGEVVLLAALLPSEMPLYRTPDAYGPADLDAIRIGGALRSTGTGVPRLSVLAPEHIGATGRSAPRLYFALDRVSERPIEVVLNDPAERAPLLEKRIEAPVAAGVHVVDLDSERVALTAGSAYDWSVSLILSDERRDSDVVSLAAIRRLPADPARPAAGEEPARTIHRLAEEGYWYDAYDQLSRWIEMEPDSRRLREYRRALLGQVGLEAVSDWLRDGEDGEPEPR